MINCNLHEIVLTVNPTSRHGKPYDLVHSEAIFQTDQPIPETEQFYVPGIEEVPSNILEMLQLGGFSFQPLLASYISQSVADFAKEVEAGEKEKVASDAILGIASQYMNKIKIQPAGNNFYHLSYDFSVLPEKNAYYLRAKMPYQGFNFNSGQIRFIVVLPTGASVDRAETSGEILTNGGKIEEEQPQSVAHGRTVVSFFYQKDPAFTVKYTY